MSDTSIDHLGVAMNIINGRPLTDTLLHEVLKKLLLLDESLNEAAIKHIRSKLEATLGIKMSVGDVVHKKEHIPWLDDAKGRTEWHYWDSYKRMLSASGLSPNVIRVLDEDTDNILTECGNPSTAGPWNIRGLVMGDVQSGKTANYSGVIAKAADSGYRLIVLLTGLIEELRKQTQERLDSGFVGRDSRDVFGENRDAKAIGAGIYRQRSANVLTSVDADFLTTNTRILGGIPLANIKEPILFVMKKNKSPLENLQKWLHRQLPLGAEKHDLSLLIIDDEADNASVNVKSDDDPATINRLIREVLSKFDKSTYVGYTATPFANVFINPDDNTDLFPSDFIYGLNAPTNYIGASSIFLAGGKHEAQLRDIDDAEKLIPLKHKRDLMVEVLPRSLFYATQVFLLSCAIRDIRGEELRHRAMLVNLSRFTDVQARVGMRLDSFLWELKEEIKQYLRAASWFKHPQLKDLFDTWTKEYSTSGITWEEIRATLYDSVASVAVVTINQKSADDEKLNYAKYKNTEKGRRVIAVGGLTLSRGLTLEGLAISYFYRNSKAYDTLLQMGRWFGYRTGYDDLFRIWMDIDAQGWYAHIAQAVNALRTDFRHMSASRLPPSRFGIRVQSHPATLIVTARNKMRHSQEFSHSISFTAFGTETPYLPRNTNLTRENIDTVRAFVRDLPPADRKGNRFLWKGVTSTKVAALISNLNISNLNTEFLVNPNGERPIASFIENNQSPILDHWDVCIPQGKGDIEIPALEIPTIDASPGTIRCRQRQFEKTPATSSYLKLNKQRVGDVSDERIGMRLEQIQAADAAWAAMHQQDPSTGERTPGHMYRRHRTNPLLTIHFIECVEPEDPEKQLHMMRKAEILNPAMVAISLSFPDFDPENKALPVVYRLNKIAIREVIGEEEDEDEEDD